MSVAVAAQGGAVLGYLALHWKDVKTRELAIPAFSSTLFGISEQVIFGVTLRNKFPLIAGCIGSVIAGGYVYISKLVSIGFGTTGIPGFAIASNLNNGYINYVIAHITAISCGAMFTILYGKVVLKSNEINKGSVISKQS